ncbi:adenine phosphoribosyltransferase [Aureibacter tunicatorum]|uniref:Adenine phosphoribosyltransferase n=1 Tax=Aureibacter tunicatorum TaxID=866807 RepID=A0AAE3XIX0_9BACT|nr:adenine phosphoribosyltransferase [Aureibacter tunicatorum]MDR6237232.1 adenine phosphoribosyltransferase [Aureibacter tunicatorum]BDD06224.1 adenine phosphoribosyltransferase [Aureibacter tunicatorum]
MTLEDLKTLIREVQDFPKEGINFKDITTAIKDPNAFQYIVDQLYLKYKDKGITKVAGIESRGFIVGAALAYKLGAGFVLIRKQGKLPAETIKKTYSLEYGEDIIEVHKDAFNENDVVLLHDDLLATGGTAKAAIDLVREFPVKDLLVNFIIELSFLKGKESIASEQNIDVDSLIVY